VVQPPLPVCPFPAGFSGTPAPLPVIHVAPRAAPVTAAAPRAAPRPPVMPRAEPVSPAAPRAALVPSPAPARYAQPVQVYWRHLAPTPAPPRYAQPKQVYRRRSAPTPAPPPAPKTPAAPTPEPSMPPPTPKPSPPPPPPTRSRVEPAVYHPPVIHRDPRHIHPMVTRRMASQAATLSAYPPLSATPWQILTGVARCKSTRLFLLTRHGTSCRVRLVAMWSQASGSRRISVGLTAHWSATRLARFSGVSSSGRVWTMMRHSVQW
jgi:hypothetical protein